jgi:hypothetical protein
VQHHRTCAVSAHFFIKRCELSDCLELMITDVIIDQVNMNSTQKQLVHTTDTGGQNGRVPCILRQVLLQAQHTLHSTVL